MKNLRYLTEDEARSSLSAGRSLQQWISVRELDGFRFIRWVSIERGEGGWLVFEKESLDDRRAGNIDITEFHNDLDPDYPEGVCHQCSTSEQALEKCLDLGCTASSFVYANQIQDIYDAYTLAHGLPARSAAEYFTQAGP
jgi:hypothetical protein